MTNTLGLQAMLTESSVTPIDQNTHSVEVVFGLANVLYFTVTLFTGRIPV